MERRGQRKTLRRRHHDFLARPESRIDGWRDGGNFGDRRSCRASGVVKLDEHDAALAMDRVRDAPPAFHLLVAPDARSDVVRMLRRRHCGGLGNDHTAVGCTLGVTFPHHRCQNHTRPLCAKPAERREHEAMPERDGADLDGREQLHLTFGRHGHSPDLWAASDAPKTASIDLRAPGSERWRVTAVPPSRRHRRAEPRP